MSIEKLRQNKGIKSPIISLKAHCTANGAILWKLLWTRCDATGQREITINKQSNQIERRS